MKERVYVVAGPTATGKTALAVELARHTDGEVVSADSMQIYRDMDIGTAKPTLEERGGIAHHMIDIVWPNEEFSAAEYQRLAKRCIEDILSRGKTPIIAGGTGLYINSITHLLDFSAPKGDEALREELNGMQSDRLYAMLQQLDAAAAERVHPNNKRRVVRAIEIAKTGGQAAEYDFERGSDEYHFCITGLSFPAREQLYDHINKRVDAMMKGGLLAEAEYLYKKYSADCASMQAIGYKEFAGYIEGDCTLDEVAEHIKRNTRRFAKRQLTWFKRDARIVWQDAGEGATAIAQKILK